MLTFFIYVELGGGCLCGPCKVLTASFVFVTERILCFFLLSHDTYFLAYIDNIFSYLLLGYVISVIEDVALKDQDNFPDHQIPK